MGHNQKPVALEQLGHFRVDRAPIPNRPEQNCRTTFQQSIAARQLAMIRGTCCWLDGIRHSFSDCRGEPRRFWKPFLKRPLGHVPFNSATDPGGTFNSHKATRVKLQTPNPALHLSSDLGVETRCLNLRTRSCEVQPSTLSWSMRTEVIWPA